MVPDTSATAQAYNVASDDRTTLSQLFAIIRDELAQYDSSFRNIEPAPCEFRPGDLRHSQVDISKTKSRLGYVPEYSIPACVRRSPVLPVK